MESSGRVFSTLAAVENLQKCSSPTCGKYLRCEEVLTGVSCGTIGTQGRNCSPLAPRQKVATIMAITNSSKFDGPDRLPSSVPVDISGFIGLTIEGLVFFGNVFPALTVFALRKRRERTVTEYFIGALAINDLLSVAIPLCVGIPTLLKRRWIGDKLSCELFETSVFWCLLNAMLLVTIMSCDRYLALARPIVYKQRVSRRILHAECLTLIVCCVTLLISCMPLLGFANSGISTSGELTHCPCLLIAKPSSSRERVFPVFLVTLGYLTLLVVSFCSIAAIRLLKDFQSRRQTRNDAGLVSAEVQNIDRLLMVSFTKLVAVQGTLFYLTWMPVVFVITLNQAGGEVNELTAVYALMSLTINSLIRPLVYCVFSWQFRQSYKSILLKCLSCCSRRRKQQQQEQAMAGLLS